MARLVAAFGSSHSPALNSPPEDFAGHLRRDEQFQHHVDREGRRTTYGQLVRNADPAIARQIDPESIASRVASCQSHIRRLSQAIQAARLDALLVVGDDQREQYLDDNMPAFLVYCGETIRNLPLAMDASAPAYWRRARSQYHEAERPRDYPVAAGLAFHLVDALVAQEFDVSCSRVLGRERGEGHAFGFVHRRLLDGGAPLPIVPVVVNTYYPPNQPHPGRCYRFGRALRAAIESWPGDERIGVIASGGLSHFTVDEVLDRHILDSLKEEKALSAIPVAKLNSGSSEIRNWIVVAGAAERLAVQWREYVPLYRSPAGTGCGMAFAAWG